jgi:hypothetical protein
MTMKATTKNDYANKLQKAGAIVRYSTDEDALIVSKGGTRVEVFFNADRFHDAWVLDAQGEPQRQTLRSMAAVERHLGIV